MFSSSTLSTSATLMRPVSFGATSPPSNLIPRSLSVHTFTDDPFSSVATNASTSSLTRGDGVVGVVIASSFGEGHIASVGEPMPSDVCATPRALRGDAGVGRQRDSRNCGDPRVSVVWSKSERGGCRTRHRQAPQNW